MSDEDNADSESSGGTGEEEQLLQQMIHERDERISNITIMTGKAEVKAGATLKKLHKIKQELASARIQQINMVDARFKHNTYIKKQIALIERDVIQQNGGLHSYANILKEAAPEAADSSYVVRMQAQLCKAMHSMGILEHQLEILNNFSAATIGGLKASMTDVMEEKTTIEIQIMNELMVVDDGKRTIEEELSRQRHEILELKQQKDLLENGEELEYDDDEDSEEEIDEDLLQEFLDERIEDVEEMREETDKQARQIEALTAKLKALNNGGPDDHDDQ
mmetsp:Transcript_31217/g.51540  ORF Transcript_31217/g.51540 Transcript_31217/m.51540 type:complete len:278 (-) Transcript_31217:100-933(-)|eukprot:CAMPEP_0119007660 /NCGR_PEP_ID=MMETSP1176-20130426/3162_1 /TAXON_ID=265551 /ORGANISM="Synedropsis recta cf, Strain CCMP1620" /LENGTH=277 /DNA_ID=CAMNT_0006959853 /DNA_START=96 /DNA_END=929 /DNA_ORIENTATION=-